MDVTIPEVVITASSNTCSIFNAANGNEIITYKDNGTFIPKTLSLIGEDYLIGAVTYGEASRSKPCGGASHLKVWTISKTKKHESASHVVPGLVSALAVSNCGRYCIAGIGAQIYVWDIISGELMNILTKHYDSITCLKFTADDSRFFSGGKDGHVLVWVLSRIIDVNNRSDTIKPNTEWIKHSAAVTDIYCGNSVSRVATTSMDMTCNVYELDSGKLLSTICMDASLTCVIMDPLEYYIFLGDERGYLYRINTYEKLPHEIHREDLDNKAALELHKAKIISLSITQDGTRLITASEDNTIRVYNLESMSCVRCTRFDGKLTSAFLAIKPIALSDEVIVPQFRVGSFQREMVKNEAKVYESIIYPKKLSLMLDGCPDACYSNSFYRMGTKAKEEEMNPRVVQETFEEAIHGQTISEVTCLNHQLFSINNIKRLDDLFPRSPSPS